VQFMKERISRRSCLALVGGAAIAPYLLDSAGQRRADVPSLLDHFILGCSKLDSGIEFVERRTGVRASFGGVHPGRGTQNALLSLGERRYVEIMAPDPAQNVTPGASVPGSRPSPVAKLRELKEPRIIGWAAHRDNLEQFAAQLREAKIEFVGPGAGSRQRPDGKVLHWKTLTLKDDHGGLLPFFIEWSADSVHPSVDAPKGCTLLRFEASTPETEDILDLVSVLGLDLYVGVSNEPALKAVLAGSKGELHVAS
jgi:Glyoxalase-like domain